VSFAGCTEQARLSSGNSLTYVKTSASSYTVTVTNAPSGVTHTYDSSTGTVS